jgi:hypothetical protein
VPWRLVTSFYSCNMRVTLVCLLYMQKKTIRGGTYRLQMPILESPAQLRNEFLQQIPNLE